ncbi:MAG: terminase family protein [Clostridiales bacterium]|nr:terminase family protein [Clostridiales bacterium]
MTKNEKYLKLSNKLLNFPKEQQEEIKSLITQDNNFILYCNKTNWTNKEHDALILLLDLEKNQNGFYKDSYGNRMSYNGIRSLKSNGTTIDMTEIHKNEMTKCANDLAYFRKYYAKIITKDGLARPEMRNYQLNLENALIPMNDVILMWNRQSGKTISISIYLLWRAIFHPTPINIGITANKGPTAAEVLDKIKKIFMELPIWMQQGIEVWNKTSIEFENRTRIMTDGPHESSFRGYTLNISYTDESAYIPLSLYEEFTDAVMPTMASLSFKQIITSSTPKGVNHFSELVKHAKNPDTPEIFVGNDWKDVPRFDKQGNKLEPEVYKAQVIKRFGLQFWLQTEECQILGSSSTLVNAESLKDIENRVESMKLIPNNILNDLNVYELVQKNHNYILSVDPSKDGIDDFSLSVTDITKFPFVQVADANLQIDFLIMPEHLNELGKYYNDALIIVENNEGSGQSITDTLWRVYEYENLFKDKNIDGKIGQKKYTGFRTTLKSRPIILNLLKIFVNEGKLIINSKKTLNQLYTFTKRKNGNKYQAEDGYKDDAVMALAILFAPFMENKIFDDYTLFVKELKMEGSNIKTAEYFSALDFGSADDGTEDYAEQERIKELKAQFANELGNDYSISG